MKVRLKSQFFSEQVWSFIGGGEAEAKLYSFLTSELDVSV